ncbi:MAG: hypothetical protein AMJ81_04250 [Phycisphaerae bacterium SM23_33]|nr:MAG: hypothetical protein AMJ81_04250 [Phycisphaerae bacterium SM23_33]
MKVDHALLLRTAGILAAISLPAGQVLAQGGAAEAASATAPARADVASYAFPADWAGDSGAAKDPTERIHQAALKWLEAAAGHCEKMVPAAEAVADRLIAGGALYVVGGEGFTNETFYRAGGFSFTRVWRRHRVRPNDVVIMGHLKPNDTGVPWIEFDAFHRFLNLRSGLIVQFTSFRWPQTQRMFQPQEKGFWGGRLHRFDTGGPPGGLEARALSQMATLALAWAFQGEVIAAATRKGKTLATYASDDEPAAKEGWDESVAGHVFHPTCKVAPVPAGKLARQYLQACREQVSQFLTGQPAQVRRAAERMARCAKAGGMIWAATSSHVLRDDCVMPHLPILWVGRDYTFQQSALRPGPDDMLLWMGYLHFPEEVVKAQTARQVPSVVVSVEGPAAEGGTGLIHIASCWKAYDSAVELPGYPIRILPTSGILHTLQWYSLMAELARLTEEKKP